MTAYVKGMLLKVTSGSFEGTIVRVANVYDRAIGHPSLVELETYCSNEGTFRSFVSENSDKLETMTEILK